MTERLGSSVLFIRVTPEERAELDRVASEQGLSAPAWVRWVLRGLLTGERVLGHPGGSSDGREGQGNG